MFQAQRRQGGVNFQPVADTAPPYALIGVRACELAALEVQDRTLRDGAYADPVYTGRRQNLFIVAVNCTESDAACFCASLGTGPGVKTGFDLALTELVEAAGHLFLIKAGSPKGEAILAKLPQQPVTPAQREKAGGLIQAAAQSQTRALKTQDLPGFLYERFDHPQWDDVAQPLPQLQQLCSGLPDLFLPCHSRSDRSGR